MTAFVLGLVVTLGYYFYTVRKARRNFADRSRNQELHGNETVHDPSNKQ